MGGVRLDVEDLGRDVGRDRRRVGQLREGGHDDAGLAESPHGPLVDRGVHDLALQSQPSHHVLRASSVLTDRHAMACPDVPVGA